MNPNDWIKSQYPVFYKNDLVAASGVGHASFVKSPDNTQSFIVYHGMQDPFLGWEARTIRTQQFTWDQMTGAPNFPRPGYGPYPVPAGQ